MNSFLLALLYNFLLSVWPKTFNCIKNLREQHGLDVLRLFRLYEREALALQKISNDILYLERCQLHRIIPSFCKLNSHHRTFFSKSEYLDYLNKCLSNELAAKKRLQQQRKIKVDDLQTLLRSRLPFITYMKCRKVVKDRLSRAHYATSVRHNGKFARLLATSEPSPPTDKVLVNLSSKTLSEAEVVLLSKGLSFSITPNRLAPLEVKTSFEEFYRQCASSAIHDEQRFMHKIRNLCYSYIYGSRKQDNLTSMERQALKKLLKEKDIVICKPDKSNGVVLMDRSEYIRKLDELVSDNTKFKKLGEDPTPQREARLQRYLLALYKKGALTKEEYDKIRPSGATASRMYGLPKTHKPQTPLRPIISAIGSYNYNLSKFLVTILQPISKSSYCIKDSFTFAREIKDLPLFPFMCSFDVKSLFTNVPLLETIDICIAKVFSDTDVVHGISKADFKRLLCYATQDSHFRCNGEIYDQIDGVAMGSPLGPVLADIFMSHLEEKMLSCYSGAKPLYYRRYVDDTFLIFNNSAEALAFFGYANSQHHSIEFTMDQEVNNSLAFLDVLVTRNPIGSLQTSVYRKTTFSGLYQKWTSCVPKSFKLSLVSGLFHRAWNICLDHRLFNAEALRIKELLRQNGYPTKFLNSCLVKFLNRIHQNPNTTSQPFGPEKKSLYLFLPYLGKYSDATKRQILRLISSTMPWAQPKVFFSASFKLKMLSKLKDPVPLLSQSRVVYQIKCPSCHSFYVGQTSRRLGQRMHEHRITTNGPVRTHTTMTGHIVDTSNPQILARDSNLGRLLTKESLLIRDLGADKSLNGNVGTAKLYLW